MEISNTLKILYFVHISLHKKIFPFTKIHELLDNNHRNSEYKLKNSSLKLRSFFWHKKILNGIQDHRRHLRHRFHLHTSVSGYKVF